ncbi:unnamed protein product [Ambrosiozyma monospora]|uniref:Unnamed protein product n=1 Tax=Ambrosiozyma monospora TaxID=43982 RepID=A0ACB5T4M4_AMBMO|nr:unnamed protein product [Ambrosiozyma monospora]
MIKDFKEHNHCFDADKPSGAINSEIKRSRLIYFLVRWFAFDDILTRLSSPLEPTDEEVTQLAGKTRLFGTSNSAEGSSVNSTPWDALNDLGTSPDSTETPTDKIEPLPDKPTTQKPASQDDNFDIHVDTAQPQMDYDIDETNDPKSIVHDESHQDIDYFLGFNIKFLPLYARLCKLIKYTNVLKKVNKMAMTNWASLSPNSPSSPVLLSPGLPFGELQLSPKTVTKAIELQFEFLKLKKDEFIKVSEIHDGGNKSDEEKAKSKAEAKALNSIFATNQCFLFMGLIQLYRRVLLVPRSSPAVQQLSHDLIKLYLKYVHPQSTTHSASNPTSNTNVNTNSNGTPNNDDSPGRLCLLLPVFIGAAECTNPEIQQQYASILNDFHQRGSPTACFGLDICEVCWRDSRDWWEVMITEKIEVSLI